MISDSYYYCFVCERVEPIERAEKIFKTGFNRIGNDNFHVGYCRLNPDDFPKTGLIYPPNTKPGT